MICSCTTLIWKVWSLVYFMENFILVLYALIFPLFCGNHITEWFFTTSGTRTCHHNTYTLTISLHKYKDRVKHPLLVRVPSLARFFDNLIETSYLFKVARGLTFASSHLVEEKPCLGVSFDNQKYKKTNSSFVFFLKNDSFT